ncbi:selenide, water dikinase SelD, partial [Cetobacterium sp.]
MGPEVLSSLLKNLPSVEDKNLIVGFEKSDDAAIYKLTDDIALIQTLDFFTPMIDDPYIFGQIAAANSLSDVYAMGGEPRTAMNIVCFPEKENIEILGEILRGGAEKIAESGAVLSGGHSIHDPEIKYGLSVTGLVHPDKVFKNYGSQEGDVLII